MLGTFAIFLKFYFKNEVPSTSTCVFDTANLKNGDLIFRWGQGLWSDIMRKYTTSDDRFSHIGVIVKNSDGVFVIHAEGDDLTGKGSVVKEPFEDFVKKSNRTGIYRLKNVSAEKFAKIAFSKLGVPFDWKFDAENADALYCTELIYVSLKETDPNIDLQKSILYGHKIIPLDIFLSPKISEEVYDSGK